MIKRIFLCIGLLVGLCGINAEGATPNLSGELAVGSWYGRALPVDPAKSPFPEVVMTPTFLADGTVIANDSHELTNPHASAHGHWVKTGENKMHAVFVWLNLSTNTPSGFAGAFKVKMWAQVNPASPDSMSGQLEGLVFPPGTDPMDPNDTGAISAGIFNIVSLVRIKPDKEQPVAGDLAKELSVGSWYGNALPADPATAPFPEVVMTPTFLADGTVLANDSQELNAPHEAGHGQWIKTGDNQFHAMFVWLNVSADTPNGFAGAFKVRMWGQVDPATPDKLTGYVEPVFFPPGTDPMDPNDTGGISGGRFNIAGLSRIKADKAQPVAGDLAKELSVGSWYGRALPENPATAPFPEVVMTPTFMADGAVIANDSQELKSPHTMSHGQWIKTGNNQFHAVFVWLNVSNTTPSGFAGAVKVRMWGQVNPATPNVLTGYVEPLIFPPGTDPMDTNDTGAISGGRFNLIALKRIDANPQGRYLKDATVLAQVLQNDSPLSGVTVAFGQGVAGFATNYKWTGTTDANGVATLHITVDGRRPTGYYMARATDASGAVVGKWNSIPINAGDQTQVTLPVGGKAQVTGAIALDFVPPLALSANVPNPFNPATQIGYQLSERREVRLVIFNNLGQEVRVLVDGVQAPGAYRVTWDGKDADGRSVASGLYFYRLSSGAISQTRQMLLLK